MSEAFRALDMSSCEKEQIQVGDKTVVRFLGVGGDFSTIPDNNLFILDKDGNVIWDMSRVLKRPAPAVDIYIGEGTLYFHDHMGMRYGIDLETLELVYKVFTK